jgi:hypothetical protein
MHGQPIAMPGIAMRFSQSSVSAGIMNHRLCVGMIGVFLAMGLTGTGRGKN